MSRRGTTLLEMLTVVSLLTVVTAIGVTLLVSLLRMQRQSNSDIDQRRTLAQLAAHWREDAHAAADARLPEDGRLRLTLDNRRLVEYAAAGSRVHRRVLEGDEVRHQETFRFPATCHMRIDLENLESGEQLVRFRIRSRLQASRQEPAALPALLEAAVGTGRLSPRKEEVRP